MLWLDGAGGLFSGEEKEQDDNYNDNNDAATTATETSKT
jgi:hypothetical protein